jgi:hypothetical protein
MKRLFSSSSVKIHLIVGVAAALASPAGAAIARYQPVSTGASATFDAASGRSGTLTIPFVRTSGPSFAPASFLQEFSFSGLSGNSAHLFDDPPRANYTGVDPNELTIFQTIPTSFPKNLRSIAVASPGPYRNQRTVQEAIDRGDIDLMGTVTVTLAPLTNAPGTYVNGEIYSMGFGNSTADDNGFKNNIWQSWPSDVTGQIVPNPVAPTDPYTESLLTNPFETITFNYTASQVQFNPGRLDSSQARPVFFIEGRSFIDFDVIPEPSSGVLLISAAGLLLRRRRG